MFGDVSFCPPCGRPGAWFRRCVQVIAVASVVAVHAGAAGSGQVALQPGAGGPSSVAATTDPSTASPAAAAAALRARHAELLPQLHASPFGEPVVLGSRESGDRVGGNVHAVVDHAFPQVSAALGTPTAVCELLMLHLNVHGCAPELPGAAGAATVLVLVVGPKRSAALEPSYHMRYRLRSEAAGTGYLRVSLQAERGPLSTRDYRIVFEAVALDDRRSFVRLDYAYSTGLVARLAMNAYLATAGRSKIGFTIVGHDADGRPVHVRGERAALERNVLRYYLALIAVCTASQQPQPARAEARLRTWFLLTERHAAQLHELDWDEYRQEKRAHLARGVNTGR